MCVFPFLCHPQKVFQATPCNFQLQIQNYKSKASIKNQNLFFLLQVIAAHFFHKFPALRNYDLFTNIGIILNAFDMYAN